MILVAALPPLLRPLSSFPLSKHATSRVVGVKSRFCSKTGQMLATINLQQKQRGQQKSDDWCFSHSNLYKTVFYFRIGRLENMIYERRPAVGTSFVEHIRYRTILNFKRITVETFCIFLSYNAPRYTVEIKSQVEFK